MSIGAGKMAIIRIEVSLRFFVSATRSSNPVMWWPGYVPRFAQVPQSTPGPP